MVQYGRVEWIPSLGNTANYCWNNRHNVPPSELGVPLHGKPVFNVSTHVLVFTLNEMTMCSPGIASKVYEKDLQDESRLEHQEIMTPVAELHSVCVPLIGFVVVADTGSKGPQFAKIPGHCAMHFHTWKIVAIMST